MDFEAWKALAQRLPGGGRKHGSTLSQEVAACALLGHGVPFRVALRFWEELDVLGLLFTPTEAEILNVLQRFLWLEDRPVRYRFAQQRAGTVAQGVCLAESLGPAQGADLDDLMFRGLWLKVSGIGPKAASLITRNWRASEQVAIIDILTYRVLVDLGYTTLTLTERNYYKLEQSFLKLAQDMEVRPTQLDEAIVAWRRNL